MTNEGKVTRGASRRTIVTGAAWSVPVIAAAMAAPAAAASPGRYQTIAHGRMLSGSLLNINLDSLVELAGVTSTNSVGISGGATRLPTNALPNGTDTFKNPLDLTALSLVPLNLNPLSNVLQLPVDTDLGLIAQYAQALYSGQSTGASGAVTDSGAIALNAQQASSAPALATLDLKSLVASISPGLSTAIAALTNLTLVIGAVAGTSHRDVAVQPEVFLREYLAAYLRLQVASPVVKTVSTTASTAIDGVQTIANGLLGNAGIVNGLTTEVAALLNGLLNGGILGNLGLANIKLTSITATVPLIPVRNFLANPITDPNNGLNISLADGTVTVDLAALLASANPGSYSNQLNGLAPNTNLLINGAVINTLHNALTLALQNWLKALVALLRAQIASTSIEAVVSMELKLPIVGTVVARPTVTIKGTLAQLLGTTPGVNVQVASGIILVGPLLDALLDGITSALTTGVAPILGGLINTVLQTAADGVNTTVSGTLTPVVNLVELIFNELFNPTPPNNPILNLVVNAQNWADNSTAGPAAFSTVAGRYEVAALWLEVLPLLANGVNLYLGRAWAGQNNVLP